MKRIVAIGGGSMLEGATASIDKEIVRLTGKKKPAALFIPTASNDDGEYCNGFKKIYGNKYGCDIDFLLLLKNPPPFEIIKKKIDEADIIYVGGGNTLMMMRRWRLLGVDKLLIDACNDGKVMAGTSAGAICWFQYGHSDSMSFYHPDNWDWIRVKCLGILPFTACPHCLAEGRMEHFKNMIARTGQAAIALDDCTAFELVDDDQYRILRSRPGAQAFKVYKYKGRVFTDAFPVSNGFSQIKSLFTPPDKSR